MKRTISITLACIAFISSKAQDTTIIYFDKAWKETSKENAVYYRKKFTTPEHKWGVIDYHSNGRIRMTASFSNDSCTEFDGLNTWYHENGKPSRTCFYKKGTVDGADIYYFDNGQKRIEGTFVQGKLNGEWNSWFRSGAIAAKATYKNDEQVSAEFFNEDGSKNRSRELFYQPASFPGGVKALAKYLKENLEYPQKAIKDNISGQVVVQFVVQKNGRITDVAVYKSVDPLLDKEALRVVKAMPPWEPAYFGGDLTEFYARQPITFKF